jgi:hypothetical protein
MKSTDDRRNEAGQWTKSFMSDGLLLRSKSYAIWLSIMDRCKPGSYTKLMSPSYKDCYTSEQFADFQKFTSWHVDQIGYGAPNYQLDKDILKAGNKCYGEDTCVLVPHQLNMFLVARNAARGKYPQGVSLIKNKNRFLANMSIAGKHFYLGTYTTPGEASAAYKAAKETEARRWYQRLFAGEFIVDPRVIERMRTWTFEEVCAAEVSA